MRSPALVFFFAAFLVFNLNCRPISSGDTAPAALLPFCILLDGSLTFDRYEAWMAERYGGSAYFFLHSRGHAYSSYPILQPLLLTPFYSPVLLVAGLRDWPLASQVLLARVLEKIFASLIAALVVAFFYRLARRYLTVAHSAILTALLAFATNTWSTASQALWQHGASELCLVLTLLCMSREKDGPASRWAWAGAGLFAALSVAVRPSNFLFFAVAACVAGLGGFRRRVLASFAVSGVLIGVPLALYNLYVAGNLRGGYTQPLNGDPVAGLTGLLFSPGRGLFFFTPVLLLLGPALWRRLRRRGAPEGWIYYTCAATAAAHVLLLAKWPAWWAGECYGPRFMTDVSPCLAFLLAPILPVLEARRALRWAFAALLLYSVGVQLVGSFCYPAGEWDSKPVPFGRSLYRLWDWKDNPILRNAAAGVNLKGHRLLAEMAAARLNGRPVEWPELHIQ